MKRILATLALAALSTGAMAQYNTRVQLQLGGFTTVGANSYHGQFDKPYFNNFGASVQHNMCKHYSIKLNYQRWGSPYFGEQISPRYKEFSYTAYYDATGDNFKAGMLAERLNYNIAELVPVYTKRMGRHELSGSAGLSVAWGVEGRLIAAPPDFDIFVGETPTVWFRPEYTRQMHVGGVAEAGYNYRLGRISTGLSGAYRFYGKDFTTINLQLNIGYNFNSFK